MAGWFYCKFTNPGHERKLVPVTALCRMHDRVYLLHVSVSPATARAARRSSSPAQQQQLLASAARLRDPRIYAGPDMSDTEKKVSRTRLSAFD
eukprot:scaffold100663_cov105-Phaeocystis_antarctica.AAC.1